MSVKMCLQAEQTEEQEQEEEEDEYTEWQQFLDLPCAVCGTVYYPRRRERKRYKVRGIRFFKCSRCDQWIHTGCSRHADRPLTHAGRNPCCDNCLRRGEPRGR